MGMTMEPAANASLSLIHFIAAIVCIVFAAPNLSSRFRERSNQALSSIVGRDQNVGTFVRAAQAASFPTGSLGLFVAVAYLTQGQTGIWGGLWMPFSAVLVASILLYLCVVLFNRPKWAVYRPYRNQPGLLGWTRQ
jgi:hypothetical protein